MKYHKEHTDNPFGNLKLEITNNVLNTINNLSKTALKIYCYINVYSYREDGIVYFDIKEAKEICGFKGNKSIYNALSELINSDILAGRKNANEYYFNPKYINKQKELL